ESVNVHAIDLTDAGAEHVYGSEGKQGLAIDDPLLFLSQPDSIALTRPFAGRRKLALGDSVDLMTPSGRRSFTIRALLEPSGLAAAYGGNLLLMDIDAAQKVFARPGFVSGIDVVVKRGADVDVVREAIARALPSGLQVRSPAQRQADLGKVMQSLPV